MFKSIFVARIAEQSRAVELFCRFDDGNAAASLPPDASLGGFCFPLGVNQVKPKEYMAPEEFSFTLTGGDGSRLHGFCRSFLPPRPKFKDPRTNTNLRYPQVVCVISAFPWFALYQKVLQIVEQLLKQTDILHSPSSRTLPLTSPAGAFLLEVVRTCPNPPIPGRVFRVDWPSVSCRPDISPPRRIGTFLAAGQEPFLQSTAQFIELEIPPDSGNGIWNAGIPLARLLWALPAPALMTLVASLLLERRVILTARDTDTVSACVHAAAALLYPFRWQHIYLPLLPYALKDYLTAPMPFLVGLPAHMLPLLKQLPMDEVVLVDLDLGSCEPQAGSARDDALRLPWAAHLREALQVVYNTLRSPTEYESTPIIGHLMQEYFLKVIGRYREFVQPDGELQIKAATPTSDTAAQKSHRPAAAGGPHKHAAKDDGIIRHAGHHFDHKAFVASQKRSDVARAFLDLFRHSQMFEVFMNERLELARAAYRTSDSFELKVTYVANKRSNKIGKSLVTASAKSVSNLSQMLQKTSQMVKTFRHSQSFSEEGELGVLPSFASQPGRGADAGLRGQADLPQRSQHSMSSLFRTSMTGESLVAEVQPERRKDSHANMRSQPEAAAVGAQIAAIIHFDSLALHDDMTVLPAAASAHVLPSTSAQPSPPRAALALAPITSGVANLPLLIDFGDEDSPACTPGRALPPAGQQPAPEEAPFAGVEAMQWGSPGAAPANGWTSFGDMLGLNSAPCSAAPAESASAADRPGSQPVPLPWPPPDPFADLANLHVMPSEGGGQEPVGRSGALACASTCTALPHEWAAFNPAVPPPSPLPSGSVSVAQSASGSAVPAGSLPIELAIEKPREYMLVSHQPPDQSDQWSDWAAGTKAASPPGRTSPQRQTSLLDM